MDLIVAAFVLSCVLLTLALVLPVILRGRQQIVVEQATTAEDPLPAWAYVERMDVPGKYPAVQTRNTRIIK